MQVDTTFREALSHISPANLVRKDSLLPCNQEWQPGQMTVLCNLKVLKPQHEGVAQCIELALCLLLFSLCQMSWPLAVQSGSQHSHVTLVPNTWSATAPLTVLSMIKVAKGPTPRPVAVTASFHLSSLSLTTEFSLELATAWTTLIPNS